MRKLISKLFGFRSPSPADPSSRPDFAVSRMTEESPATIEDGSDNALRRQLVYVLLRDVLRRHGIPASLVECQMLVVSSRSRGPGMYVRLVLKQWDERLVRYAFAFQKALKADILRFEARHSCRARIETKCARTLRAFLQVSPGTRAGRGLKQICCWCRWR